MITEFDIPPNEGSDGTPEDIACDCVERWADDWHRYEPLRKMILEDAWADYLIEDVFALVFRKEDRDERIGDLEVILRNFAIRSAENLDLEGDGGY